MTKLSFQIFIAGKSNRNVQLIQSFEEACALHLKKNSYEITVIDITLKVQVANRHKILATPTVLRTYPIPEKRVIGHLNKEGSQQALLFLIEDLNHTLYEKA